MVLGDSLPFRRSLNVARHTGQFLDSLGTGQYYNRYRTYDAALGRYLQADPLVSVSPMNHNWTPYAYTGNNPVNFLDLLGLELVPVTLPGIGETYLDDAFAPMVRRLIDEAAARGVNVHVNSAYRTPEQQEALRRDPDAITPATQSLHSCGFAIDVNFRSLASDEQRQALLEAARAAGLSWGGDFQNPDPPHFYDDPGGDRGELIRSATERYRDLTQVAE